MSNNKYKQKKPFIIVTGGDAKYFLMIKDLVSSIKALPEGRDAPIGILDGGLEKEQVDYLRNYNAEVIRPEWPDERTRKRAKDREYLLINLNKPSLDKYFGDYDTIIWLDADTWVQTWEAIGLFRKVAGKNKLAVVTKTSRLRPRVMRMSHRIFGWVRPRGFLYNNARRAKLPVRITRSLVNKSVFNAGAYALNSQSPHWQRWRHWQNICIKKGRLFSSDQLSMALTVYEDNLPYEALPDICNYMGPWRVNRQSGMFLDYFAPYQPVSIIHMVGKITPKTRSGEKMPAIDEEDEPVNVYMGFLSAGERIE